MNWPVGLNSDDEDPPNPLAVPLIVVVVIDVVAVAERGAFELVMAADAFPMSIGLIVRGLSAKFYSIHFGHTYIDKINRKKNEGRVRELL